LGAGISAWRAAARTERLVNVSRRGRPGLQSGDWVMKGPASWSNYLRSGKWDPSGWNQFASKSSGQTFAVPNSTLHAPDESWFTNGIKYLLGQRIYRP